MKKLSVILLLVLLISIFVPDSVVIADKLDKYSSLIGVSVAVSDNTDITYTGKHLDYTNGSETYEYIARINQAPIYNDDGTLVNCSWHQAAQDVYIETNESRIDSKGKNVSVVVRQLVSPASYVIKDNVFSAIVTGSAISTTYQGQTMSWNPVVFIDDKKYVANGSPKLIAVDPINSYYKNNTLEWDYGICVRRVRVIEGLIQETWTFDKDPVGTVWIKDNAQKPIGFEWAIAPYAYDANNTPIPINQYKQVMAKDMANAVYPVVIDPTEVYVTSASDGDVAFLAAGAYGVVHDAVNGNYVSATATNAVIGQLTAGTEWRIFRSFVFFNTSAIPDTATITAANLSLYGELDGSTVDCNLTVQNGQPTRPSDPLGVSDYNMNNYTGDGGSKSTATFITTGYNNISLNATGISWIDIAGTTKLCLRNSLDIASSPQYSYVQVYTYEKGSGYRPTLYVTYVSSGAPTVTTSSATYVTRTTAQLNGYLSADGGEPCTVWFNYSVNGSGIYNVTANQTGKISGDLFSASLTGLTPDTLYNFSAVAWNSYGQVNGSWLQFNTSLTLQAPTGIVCSAGSNAISLSWTKGGNTSQTYIRYKVGSYPTGTTDGNAVANQSGNYYYHTGLLSGTSYYYRLWGMDGGNFSTTNATSMCSTTAGVINVSTNTLPVTNTSEWWNDPNESALVNNPLYPAVNLMADSIGIEHNFWWLLLGIGTLVIGGIIVYTRTNKNVLLSMIVVIVLGIILAETGVFPLWVMIVLGFTGIGMSWKELR